MKPVKFAKEDWLAFGLTQLASAGPNALKVSVLCNAAGKTIGSFYHHFKDQSAYFEALLRYWKQKNTIDVIEQVSADSQGASKAKQLEIIAMAMDQREDIGIRVLAHQETLAAAVVAEVDQMRIAFMQSLYQDQLRVSSSDAKLLAELEYAAFVGTQTVWPRGSTEFGQSLSELFHRMVKTHCTGA